MKMTALRNKSFCKVLRKLLRLKPSLRLQALQLANDTFIRKICTHIQNMRYKTFTKQKWKKVKRHRKSLRKLVNTRTSLTTKRKLLSQKGGFLFPLIIAATAGPAIVKNVATQAASSATDAALNRIESRANKMINRISSI